MNGGVEKEFFFRAFICCEIGLADSRRSGGLQPCLGGGGLFFAFAKRKIFAISPEVATFGRNLLAKEGHGFIQSGDGFIFGWWLLGACIYREQKAQNDGGVGAADHGKGGGEWARESGRLC